MAKKEKKRLKRLKKVKKAKMLKGLKRLKGYNGYLINSATAQIEFQSLSFLPSSFSSYTLLLHECG